MKKLAKITGLCTFAFVVCGAPAMADPTTGGPPDRKSPAATVTVPTSTINRVSAKYSTDNFTCDTTERTMINRQINNTSPGTVVVHFEGEFFPGGRVFISLRRNGVVVPGPGQVGAELAAHDSSDQLSTNGFVWAVPNVPAGLQTFAVTCDVFSGSSTLADEREIVIYHR
jgi:hypothetical protein